MLLIKQSHSSNYSPRTYHNAREGVVTAAFAVDFLTAGERLTKKAAGENYVGVPLYASAKDAAAAVINALRAAGASSLNIAGNGIYTLSKHGWTQPRLNQHLFEVLDLVSREIELTKIVSGGQTGVDMAGIVAAKALGVRMIVATLPKGYVQRHEDGIDREHTHEEILEAVMREVEALRPDAAQGDKPRAEQGGRIRVVSKRAGGTRAEPGEIVIDGDRKNPILGNRHFLKDFKDADERARVIQKHKTLDFEPDMARQGPIYHEVIKLARMVADGKKIALACWCAPLPCHCDHIATAVREHATKLSPATATRNQISGFQGEHRWLSNFWAAKVSLAGVEYPTVEHAYQAAKTMDPVMREEIRACSTPHEAKAMSKQLKPRPDWDEIRVGVMRDLLLQKFSQVRMRSLLLATENSELIESNTWGDVFWGVCRGRGENMLGKLIMEIRSSLRTAPALEPDSSPVPALSSGSPAPYRRSIFPR